MTAHTPGEWSADGLHHVWRRYEDEQGRRVHRPVAEALVVGEQHEEAQANARLIAAAPDLLEAAQTLVAVLDHGARIVGSRAADLAEARLRAAIAKAEGRS